MRAVDAVTDAAERTVKSHLSRRTTRSVCVRDLAYVCAGLLRPWHARARAGNEHDAAHQERGVELQLPACAFAL